MKVLIADDEPVLADYLANKLAKLWPELEIIGIAHSGRKALALAEAQRPDVAFLDIHMPGMTGLQAAELLPEEVSIVFVTAFDQYAIEAFEQAAVDYLLKPVAEDRLSQTLNRLQQARAKPPGGASETREALVKLMREISGSPPKLQWLKAQQGETTTLVAIDDVVYFKSSQKYTEVYTRDKTYLIRQSVRELEQSLDSSDFWRIHRGLLVRVAQIKSATKDFGGKYIVSLNDRAESLVCSKRYAHLFRQS